MHADLRGRHHGLAHGEQHVPGGGQGGLTPSCVIAPGPIFVDDSALDAAGQAAVSAAMADWNAPGGAGHFFERTACSRTSG